MNYLNVSLAELDTPEFLTAKPEQQGAWLCLSAFCARQENGGFILNCRNWPPLHWERIARVNADIIKESAPLWGWEGDSLRIRFYPIAHELACKAKREAGRRGGRPPENHMDTHMDGHMANHDRTVIEKEKEKKSKGKRKNNDGAFAPPTIEQVRAYCQERGNAVDPERFHAYYTANGWKVGRNPMKDWRAAVRSTWERPENNPPKRPAAVEEVKPWA